MVGHELFQSGVGGFLDFGRFRDSFSGTQVGSELLVGFGSFWFQYLGLVSMYLLVLVVSRFGLCHCQVWFYTIAFLGGVFCWKILARVEMVLLGTWWGVVGLVSWFWFLVGVRFGFGLGLVFLGLVLVDLARPV